MADVTLDKPKTSFSFQGAPGSNSLLFFSFLFSCLLSEGGEEEEEEEEEYVPSAEWTWCNIPFPHPLGCLPEATSSRTCEDPVGTASRGWAVPLRRGITAVGRVLAAGAAALEGADVPLQRCCPAQPHSPVEGLAGEGGSGWF